MTHVVVEGPKGASKYVSLVTRTEASSEAPTDRWSTQSRRYHRSNGLSLGGNAKI